MPKKAKYSEDKMYIASLLDYPPTLNILYKNLRKRIRLATKLAKESYIKLYLLIRLVILLPVKKLNNKLLNNLVKLDNLSIYIKRYIYRSINV
ncbi:uncharacterized protein N7518_003492 [Penicillium psychrosexuale]|uniref:uncharacterized protein n=1 Tax=Penicillium psychrosexuale TaxID=1002107 RepID=UPI002545AC0F|nr:uncharacterized protein N7518_003492 [Penicillium psychrosexuale]KAJ5801424.1 hypothetical protein N7518_003492 [Penicillium psychrosexuale]